MNQPKSLQSGTRIDHYEITETLWTTNSGFTYLARDLDRERDVLVQEYLPAMLAARHWSGIHAMPLDGLAEEFDQGLTRFLREARILAQINDPYVCRVYEYTEANATAYLVMDHEPGQTLKDHLAERGAPLDEGEIRKMLVPLLKGLKVAHAAELLHRDIHPANIYLRDVGPPVLIGFGSPVFTVREDGDPHIEKLVAPGYSPVEQYQSDGELGPWSDLYALGATMYRCLAGVAPVDAAHRVTDIAQDKEDPLVPATELGVSDYSSGLLGAIDWMMEPMASDRPASASAVLGPLTTERPAAQPKPPADRHAPGGGRNPNTVPGGHTEPGRSPVQPAENAPAQDRPTAPARRAPPPAPLSVPKAAPADRSHRRSGRRIGTGLGWPALLVAAGVSMLAFFVFYEPGPTQSVSVSDVPPGMEVSAVDPDEADPPPELPDQVNFGREKDDERAEEYRDLEQRTGEIERMLAAARLNMDAGRLISPAGDNALANYRAILALEPEQTDARLGIGEIQTELVNAAETAFEDNEDVDGALRLLDQAGEIREESSRGQALRRDIERHLAEKERQERLARLAEEHREEARRQAEQARLEEIRELLEQAEAALNTGRLTQPPGDNALAFYQRALRLAPDQPEARQGIEQIGERFLARASDAIAANDLDRADGLLSTAAAILPSDETIARLRERLDARRVVAEQRERVERRRLAALETPNEATDAAPAAPAAVESPDAGETRRLEDGVAAYYAGDYDIAYRLLNPLAENGQPRARFRVAMMYYHGRGVNQDVNLAETFIREALPAIRERVEQGAAWAQADLASLYADGIVVAENDKEAVRLYTLAAEQGYAGAQTNLGVMYANGEGVFRNRDNAIQWFRRAAEQGDRIAQKNLQALGVE
ncbi:MAG: protein kinase [Gammaproteobacteria bacterium]|nr:protein kinase [Gammaproteobacteria bacterium]